MIHQRGRGRGRSEETIFGSPESELTLPKYRVPRYESKSEVILELIRDELFLDGNARQNLATFCQTYADDEVRQLMDLCIDKNIIDKDEYPQSTEIESRCIHMLANLWNAPESCHPVGTSTVGSSEACMLGGLAMYFRWKQARKQVGKPTDRPNLVSGPVQVCWEKFARYWDIELRQVPMEPGRLAITPEAMLPYLDENTIGVVTTLGLTFTGAYEPVEAICQALDRVQQEKGWRPVRPCGRGLRRVCSPLLCPAEAPVGLPQPPGEVHQRLGSQVRPLPPGVRLCAVAGPGGSAGAAYVPRQLPGGRHGGVPVELLPTGGAGDLPVLPTAPAGLCWLPEDPHELL